MQDRPDRDPWVDAIESDYRSAQLDPADREMLDFAVALTLTPGKINRESIAKLRRNGFDDDGINDIVMVTAIFNYYNRIADGLGIEAEPEWSRDAAKR